MICSACMLISAWLAFTKWHRNTKRDVTSFSNSAFVSTLHCSIMPCHSSSSATHYPSLFTSSPTFFDAPMGHFVSVTWMKSCTQSLSM